MAALTQPEAERQLTAAYDLYADAIFRFCYFRVFNRERAQELMQETFLRTWRHFMENGTPIDNIRAWLYKTAQHLVIDESRKRTTSSLEELQMQGFDPKGADGRSLIDQVDAAQAVTLLEKISEPYRTAVTLRYLAELSPKEIAVLVEASENTVSVRIHRGLEQLRRLIQ